MASSRDEPHISGWGRRPEQGLGRAGEPNRAHRVSAVRCGHRTPASFPWGKPGIGALIDGAIQQAPQPSRHSKGGDYAAIEAAAAVALAAAAASVPTVYTATFVRFLP